jgi:hypothetical protein
MKILVLLYRRNGKNSVKVRHLIYDNKIIVKYPLIKKREYNLEKLVGFSYPNAVEGFGEFVIYFSKEKISLTPNNFRSDKIVKNFILKYHDIIMGKNISKLLFNYIEIIINKKLKLIFFKDKMEISNYF